MYCMCRQSNNPAGECNVSISSGPAEHAIPHLQLFKNDLQVERKSWDVQRLILKKENKQLIETLDATNRLFLKVRAGTANALRMLNRTSLVWVLTKALDCLHAQSFLQA